MNLKFFVLLAFLLVFTPCLSFASLSIDGYGVWTWNPAQTPTTGTCMDLDILASGNYSDYSVANLTVSCSSPDADIECMGENGVKTLNNLKGTELTTGTPTHAYGLFWDTGTTYKEDFKRVMSVTSDGRYVKLKTAAYYGQPTWCYDIEIDMKNATNAPYWTWSKSSDIFASVYKGNITAGSLVSGQVWIDTLDAGWSYTNVTGSDLSYHNSVTGYPNCIKPIYNGKRGFPSGEYDSSPVNNLEYFGYWAYSSYVSDWYCEVNAYPQVYSKVAIQNINQTNKAYDNYTYMGLKFIDNSVADLDPYLIFYALYQDSAAGMSDPVIIPDPPSAGSETYVAWSTILEADSRLYFRYAPVTNLSSFSSYIGLLNSTYVTNHLISIPTYYLVAGRYYEWFVESDRYGSLTNSTVHNFTLTDGGTTTTTTIPVSECDAASIGGLTVSDNVPALGQDVTFKVYVTNNGTLPCNYYVGLSVGNASIVCNHDCYTDCVDYADVNCSYGRTGIVHQGATAIVTRTFRMRNDYFQANHNYSVYAAAYGQPYLPAEQALDYYTAYEWIGIPTFGEKNVSAYAISQVTTPTMTVKNGEVKIRSYIINNGTATHSFMLGMSIGTWTSAVDGQHYNNTLAWDIAPCNTECYTDGLGSYANLTIPAGYTAPFERIIRVPDYFLEENYFDVVIGVYIEGIPISYTYFRNVAFVQSNATASALQPPNLLEVGGMFMGSITGAGLLGGLLLEMVIILIVVGILAAKYSGHVEVGIASMAILLFAFFIIEAAIIPLWFVAIVVLALVILAANKFGNLFGSVS